MVAVVALEVDVLVVQLVALGQELSVNPNIEEEVRKWLTLPEQMPADPPAGATQLPADQHALLHGAIEFLCECHDEEISNAPPAEQPEVDNSLPTDTDDAPDAAPEQPDSAPEPTPRKK